MDGFSFAFLSISIILQLVVLVLNNIYLEPVPLSLLVTLAKSKRLLKWSASGLSLRINKVLSQRLGLVL